MNAVKALTACLLFSSCEENGVSSPPSCGKHNLPGCDSCGRNGGRNGLHVED